jgi:Uma2 family endonuclease
VKSGCEEIVGQVSNLPHFQRNGRLQTCPTTKNHRLSARGVTPAVRSHRRGKPGGSLGCAVPLKRSFTGGKAAAMSRAFRSHILVAREPEPTWEIAYLFPYQGAWSEEEYLGLDGNHLVEFSNGVLEVLPMPTTPHQLLVLYLYELLSSFIGIRDLGAVLVAPLRVRLWRRKFREPDVVFMGKEHAARIGVKYWKGADLVMEVVSGDPDDRHRDLVVKREEYARAGIAEYWIVDPQERRIQVLRLARKRYVAHGEFVEGMAASSALLPGLTVDVAAAFAKGESLTGKARPARKTKRG